MDKKIWENIRTSGYLFSSSIKHFYLNENFILQFGYIFQKIRNKNKKKYIVLLKIKENIYFYILYVKHYILMC